MTDPASLRRRALALMLLAVAPLFRGGLRARARVHHSPDDQVSGQIIAAAKVRDDKDPGPQFDERAVQPEDRGVEVRRRRRLRRLGGGVLDLTFAELPQLANLNREATGSTSRCAGRAIW